MRMIAPRITTTKMITAPKNSATSIPSCFSEPMPYLLTVNAMAPSTPSGASLMMMPITLNNTCDKVSMKWATGAPRSPSMASAQPNSTAKSSTCSTSPVANAPTTVPGISFIRKSTVPPPVSLLALSA